MTKMPMYFQCFVIYVLRGWYTFDRKVFLVKLDFNLDLYSVSSFLLKSNEIYLEISNTASKLSIFTCTPKSKHGAISHRPCCIV